MSAELQDRPIRSGLSVLPKLAVGPPWGRDRAVNGRNAADNHGQPQPSSVQLSTPPRPSTAGHGHQPIRPDTEGAGGSTPPAPTTPAVSSTLVDHLVPMVDRYL